MGSKHKGVEQHYKTPMGSQSEPHSMKGVCMYTVHVAQQIQKSIAS